MSLGCLVTTSAQPWQRLVPRQVPDSALALGWTNLHHFHPFMRSLAAGGSAHVLVFGGSEASGVHCVEGELKLQQCAWPARLARWLAYRFNASTVAHDNYARGGTTAASNLPALPAVLDETASSARGATQLVLLDWCVNDGSLVRRGSAGGFDIDSLAGLPRRKGVSVALEKVILLVKQRLPNAIIVGVLLPSADCYFVRDAYRVVFTHHGLALLDFTIMWLALQDGNHSYAIGAELTGVDERHQALRAGSGVGLWPVCHKSEGERGSPEGEGCAEMKHPPYPYHQMVADAMAWGLERAYEREGAHIHAGKEGDFFLPAWWRALPSRLQRSFPRDGSAFGPLWPAADLERLSVCDHPLSTYDAVRAWAKVRATAVDCDMAAAGIVSSQCTLMEDVANKPGWLLQREAGSKKTASVSFEVAVGRFPTLNVVYLQSYRATGFGNVNVCIHTPGANSHACKPYTLHGQHGGTSTSQNKAEFLTLFMSMHQSSAFGSAGMSGFGVPPFAKGVRVNLTLHSGDKFKLVSLHSC